MVNKEVLKKLIFDVVDEINQQLPLEKRIEKSDDTRLFGEGGRLDSLGLMNLIVETERKIEEEFDVTISLADGEVQREIENPFLSISTLVDYVYLLIEEKQ